MGVAWFDADGAGRLWEGPWATFLDQASAPADLETFLGRLAPEVRTALEKGGESGETSLEGLPSEGIPKHLLVAWLPWHGQPQGARLFLVRDETDLRQSQEAFHHLLQGLSGLSGKAFFENMVGHLAGAFDAAFAFVGELKDGHRIGSLAFWAHGTLQTDPVEYDLAGTPCEHVMDQTACFHPEGVQALYPEDAYLAHMGVEGYLGAPLLDHQGRRIGIASVQSTSPLRPMPHALDLLAVFSARAGLELERLHTEEALRQGQQLLQRMERMNAVASLGAGLAHDLNNLIGVAKNYAELAEMDLEDGKPVDPMYLARVKEAATRAGELTAQLMAYGRGQGLKEQRFDAHLRLGTLTSLLRSVVPPLVALRVDAGLEALWIQADPTQFDQVVANLVLNARDALPQGGSVHIRLSRGLHPHGTPGIVLDVIDDGMGMPAEIVARLGEPFFTTKGGGKGTGLGLASVRNILEQLGGTLAVTSEPGKGTAFHLWFPEAHLGTEAEG